MGVGDGNTICLTVVSSKLTHLTQIKIKTDQVVCSLHLHYYNLVFPPSAALIPHERN